MEGRRNSGSADMASSATPFPGLPTDNVHLNCARSLKTRLVGIRFFPQTVAAVFMLVRTMAPVRFPKTT